MSVRYSYFIFCQFLLQRGLETSFSLWPLRLSASQLGNYQILPPESQQSGCGMQGWLLLHMRCLLECSPNSAYERSEEHTSELQSHVNLVCRLLLEKKKKTLQTHI